MHLDWRGVPDTAETVAAFGRHPGDRGDSAFPQVQAVYLAECGTHAIVDAGFWPCRTSERVGGRRKRGERLLLRIIEYTITDPALPGFGEVHRLATTLLDYRRCAALDLACCYHERWEIELVIHEVDDHQRLAGRPLRSLKPLGVIQELYAPLIAHYAVRFTMHEAACLAAVDPD